MKGSFWVGDKKRCIALLAGPDKPVWAGAALLYRLLFAKQNNNS